MAGGTEMDFTKTALIHLYTAYSSLQRSQQVQKVGIVGSGFGSSEEIPAWH